MLPDRAAISRQQHDSLRELLGLLAQSNDFYAPRINQTLPDSSRVTLDEFCNCFPLTTKQEIVADQASHPPFGTNLTYPMGAYTRVSQTSGTSGQAIRWLDTTASWNWMVACWATVFERSGVTADDRIFFAFSFGPFLGFWTGFNAGERVGALCMPGGGMSTLARIEAIIGNEATVLCCTPTYAIHMGQVAAENNIDLGKSSVRAIIVAGEPGAAVPATRAAIEGYWPGAKVWDHHGMTEIGPVTYQCPHHDGTLHVIEEHYIAEIINPETLKPVPPGEQGELVLTNLGRHGSPLLRYRTGDLVVAGPSMTCSCGTSELALVGGIIGRTDDMVVIRGINIWPSSIEAVLRRYPSVVEFRTTVDSTKAMADIRIDVEFDAGVTEPDAERRMIEDALRAALALRVPVQVVESGSLPRFEMKARRWIRLR
jgi:phenylacetate-CoA ligase